MHKGRIIAYALIAIGALIGTWYHNIQFMSSGAGLLEFVKATYANHAAASISIDIGFFALAACIWMVVEARRLDIPYVWAYIVFGMCIAISVTFPLFLIAREFALDRVEKAAGVSVA